MDDLMRFISDERIEQVSINSKPSQSISHRDLVRDRHDVFGCFGSDDTNEVAGAKELQG
jgi:hypothetical protein